MDRNVFKARSIMLYCPVVQMPVFILIKMCITAATCSRIESVSQNVARTVKIISITMMLSENWLLFNSRFRAWKIFPGITTGLKINACAVCTQTEFLQMYNNIHSYSSVEYCFIQLGIEMNNKFEHLYKIKGNLKQKRIIFISRRHDATYELFSRSFTFYVSYSLGE